RKRRTFPTPDRFGVEYEEERRAFFSPFVDRYGPESGGAGVNGVINIVVVRDRHAAPILAELWRLIPFPYTRVQLNKAVRESSHLMVIVPERLDYLIRRELWQQGLLLL